MKYIGIDEDLTIYGKVISTELATVIKNNISFLKKVTPVGQIVPIMVNIPGVPTPDPNIWQECNGSEITNPNSPLRSRNGITAITPDMTDLYIKIGNGLGESGTSGGTHYANFRHNHGGRTGDWGSPEGADTDTDEYNVAFQHSHSINSDLNNNVNIEPPFYTVKFFMKIQ